MKSIKVDLAALGTTVRSILGTVIADGVADGILLARKRDENTLLSIEQVCGMLHVTRPTLRKWTRQGKIKGLEAQTGRWYYAAKDVYDFIDSRKKDTAEHLEQKAVRRETYRLREEYMRKEGVYISIEDFASILALSGKTFDGLQAAKAPVEQDTYNTLNP